MTTDFASVACPYCGETFETAVDASPGDDQRYVEDCAVCCRPITFVVSLDEDEALSIRTLRDDDSG